MRTRWSTRGGAAPFRENVEAFDGAADVGAESADNEESVSDDCGGEAEPGATRQVRAVRPRVLRRREHLNARQRAVNHAPIITRRLD